MARNPVTRGFAGAVAQKASREVHRPWNFWMMPALEDRNIVCPESKDHGNASSVDGSAPGQSPERTSIKLVPCLAELSGCAQAQPSPSTAAARRRGSPWNAGRPLRQLGRRPELLCL